MSFTTNQASVFVQIWVDTNAAKQGSTAGVYLVDNRFSSGSGNEGTPNLSTAASKNSIVCWQASSIDPNDTSLIQIQAFGNSNVWGPTGIPQPAGDIPTAWVGQVQNAGQAGYTITLTVQLGAGSGQTITVSPSMNVLATAAAVAA